jgi:hypothetical protein
MIAAPKPTEVAPYYFRYIDRVSNSDILSLLRTQLDTSLPAIKGISEEKSLYRYAEGKWSIRQLLNHVTDVERTFLFRSMWFARGFEGALPSFDQDIAASNSGADGCSWSNHVQEFTHTRLATHMFYTNLPLSSWARSGIASEKSFTVRSMAFIIAGHFDHHLEILRDRYLSTLK